MNHKELRKQFETEKNYPAWNCNDTVIMEYIEWLEQQLKNCNLQNVMRCACCGNSTKFSDGAKQQILIEDEYRYIYAVTCDECGKVCDVELFD